MIAAALLSMFLAAPLAPPAVSPVDQHPVDGVDVASWQHPQGAAIRWPDVANSGVDFATVKATEDNDYVNPYFRSDMDGARAAGLPVAPYHFYLARAADTGTAQAEHFVATVREAGYTGKRQLDLPPVLDLEWDWKTNQCPAQISVTDVKAWLDTVERAFGRKPVIYTNRYFMLDCMGGTKALGGYPLQIAHYGQTPPQALPPGWDTWHMWQWTAQSAVPGIQGKVTHSVFHGTAGALRELAGLARRGYE
ncbi:glycoside hydrolase family 25 protein [Longispora albida]|uniref:glycoside hydrolase family 25 protein n=1 Tax=Longispora albida TaxID=203523 RepID=UPI000366F3DE|nr:GH25 family lysozyme [Longispora albida]